MLTSIYTKMLMFRTLLDAFKTLLRSNLKDVKLTLVLQTVNTSKGRCSRNRNPRRRSNTRDFTNPKEVKGFY